MPERPHESEFGGRTLLVTGASSGIGRACAVEAARQGARVVLVGRDTDRLAAATAACHAAHPAAAHLALPLDLCDHDRVTAALTDLGGRIDRLHGLVHAAGVSLTLPLSSTPPAEFARLFAVNVTAAMHLTARAVHRERWAAEGGGVVFIASVAGLVGARGKAAYACTKGAVIAGARALAVELAPRGIRVNTIAPGVVQTPLVAAAPYARDPEALAAVTARHPLGLGTPADVAHAATFLLSDRARWITGANLVVDGGYAAS